MDNIVLLMEKYRPGLYAVAIKIVGEAESAMEILQTAAVKFIEKVDLLNSLSEPQMFTYMAVTVKHLALDYIKAERKWNNEPLPGDDSIMHYYVVSQLISLEDMHIHKENAELLHRAISELDAREQSMIIMKYFEDLPNERIGEEFGLQTDSVRSILSRIRRKLFTILLEAGYIHE